MGSITPRRQVAKKNSELRVLASWRETSLGLAAFAASISLAAAGSANVLIEALSSSDFQVTASYKNLPALKMAAFSVAGEEFRSIDVSSAGRPVGFQLRQEKRYLGLTIDPPQGTDSAIDIRYQVNSPEGRLPLFVPLQEFGSSALSLQLQLADGLRLDGESFPRFDSVSGRLRAVLANHPSQIHIPLNREGDSARLLTPSLVTNLGLIGMTLLVAGCWAWVRRVSRRGAEARRETEEGEKS